MIAKQAINEKLITINQEAPLAGGVQRVQIGFVLG